MFMHAKIIHSIPETFNPNQLDQLIIVTSRPVGLGSLVICIWYYTFGNTVYSLLSMTTCAFLVWQTYFVFCIYANDF